MSNLLFQMQENLLKKLRNSKGEILKNKKSYLFFCFFIISLLIILIGVLFLNINNFNTININDGVHYYPDGINVPAKKTLIIQPGATLKMGEDARIEVFGKIIAKGTKEKPIIFEAEKNYWRGVKIVGNSDPLDIDFYKKSLLNEQFEDTSFISSLQNGNIFKHCLFKNLQTNGIRDVANRKKAVIEAENSSILLFDISFKNVVHMGIIQTENSLLLAKQNVIDSKMVMKVFHVINSISIIYENEVSPKRYEYQTWPDGIFGNVGVGIVVNNIFDGTSDDAIDFDSSLVYIFNNKINNTSDDGIDIDNKTIAYLSNNEINSIKEDGLLISNQSIAYLLNNKVVDSFNGITLRNGGRAIGQNLNISAENGIVFHQGIPLILTNNMFNNLRESIAKITEVEMHNIGIYEAQDNNDLLDLLEKSYKKKGDYRIISESIDKSNTSFDSFLYLKKVLKLVNLAEYQNSFIDGFKQLNEEDKSKLLKYKNTLYLQDSFISSTNNATLENEPLYAKINNVEFNGGNTSTELGSHPENFYQDVNNLKSIPAKIKYTKELLNKFNDLVLNI